MIENNIANRQLHPKFIDKIDGTITNDLEAFHDNEKKISFWNSNKVSYEKAYKKHKKTKNPNGEFLKTAGTYGVSFEELFIIAKEENASVVFDKKPPGHITFNCTKCTKKQYKHIRRKLAIYADKRGRLYP